MEAANEDIYEVRQQVRYRQLCSISPGRDLNFWLMYSWLGCGSCGEQKRVHADSLQMIPDSEKRLAKAVGELEELVVS